MSCAESMKINVHKYTEIHLQNCFIDLFDRIRAITFCINRGSFPALWSQA